MKICVWDIETSPMKTYTWGLFPNNGIPHSAIIEDWHILCIAWKELGKKQVESVSCFDSGNKQDDYNVVKKVRKMLEDVDILIHHNGDEFDLKKFNSRLIYHKLPPLPRILTIDTKKIKKVARFSSHRLDFLAKVFGHAGKIKTDFDLWVDVDRGDVNAMKKMVKYCKQDVRELEKVYLDLRPYMTNHPVISDPHTRNCPCCNSSDIAKHKVRTSATGIKRQQYQCNNCGRYFQERKATPDKPLIMR